MNRTQRRRGLTLTEVLISFFVLLVGVVSVIALFPVAVRDVQNAVHDTRTALVGIEAVHEFLGMGWADDPYLVYPPHQGIPGVTNSEDPSKTAPGTTSPNGGEPRGVDPATIPPFTGTRPGFGGGGLPGWNNAYAAVMAFDGKTPARASSMPNYTVPGERMHPLAAGSAGFPVFIDPELANARDFQSDGTAGISLANPVYKRIAIAAPLTANYATIAPFAGNLNDLVVQTVSEVQYQPAGTTTTGLVNPSPRDHFIKARLGSLDQTHFEWNAPAIATNPNRAYQSGGNALPGWRYLVAGDSGAYDTPTVANPLLPPAVAAGGGPTFSTANRSNDYSYAFVVQGRKLSANPANTPILTVTGAYPATLPTPYLVPTYGDATQESVQALVFHKRPLARGYQLVRGCFFNGSAVATLCWDQGATPPDIRKGQWLMEATLSPGKKDTIPKAVAGVTFGDIPLDDSATLLATLGAPPFGTGYVKYRHKINFYRVASTEAPTVLTNAGNTYVYQVVNLEQPVQDYPISHVLGDGRSVPDLYDAGGNTTWTFDGTHAIPNVVPDDATTVWTPVVLLDGLREVFTVRK